MIRISALGKLPGDLDLGRVLRWKSSVFTLSESVESFQLVDDAGGHDWQYTDAQLDKYLNGSFDEDFHVILVTIPLEQNWYVRRLGGNRLILSINEVADILRYSNLPLHNLVLRVLYAATLLYYRYGQRIPDTNERTNYAHDETRGCLFDMNASKFDVVHSCHMPIVCEYCVAELKKDQVSNEMISKVQSEIGRIKKPLFQRIYDFVRRHPVWSIALSILTALVIGTLSSAFGTYVYELIAGRA